MVGLVGALTPVLYTQVAEKKEEIRSINKANTLLNVQRETERFLQSESNRTGLTFTNGYAVKKPSDIGLSNALDNNYQIGFKKKADGSISAMIADTEGLGDTGAAKVAGLIGVSAGIKSSMDAENAYGINGLWKEKISDYGITAPAGSVIVSTEYNKEKDKIVYTSEMLANQNIDLGDNNLKAGTVSTDELCIGDDCKGTWNDYEIDTSNSDMILFNKCQQVHSTTDDYCKRAISKGLVADCSSVAAVYSNAGLQAKPGYYYLGNSLVEKVCYFIDGEMPESALQIILACDDTSNSYRKFACMYDFQDASTGKNAGGPHEGKKYTASCQSIYNAVNELPTEYYTITSSYSETGFTSNVPCVFAGGKAANDPIETINQCRAQSGSSTTNAACALGHSQGWTTSCTAIKNAGVTTSDFYKITTSSSKGSDDYTTNITETACYFVSGNLATAVQTVTGCNSAGAGSVACGYGYQNKWNRTCDQIRAVSTDFINQTNVLTNGLKSSSGTDTCCFVSGQVPTGNNSAYCCSGKRNYSGNTCTASSSCSYGTTTDNACCPATLRQASGTACYECGSNYSCAAGYNCTSSTAGSCYQCDCYGASAGYYCINGNTLKYCNGCEYTSSTTCNSTYGCKNGISSCCECSGTGWRCVSGNLKYCNGCSYTDTTSCSCGCSEGGSSCNSTYTNGYEYQCSGTTRQRRSCTTCGGCGSWSNYETCSSTCGADSCCGKSCTCGCSSGSCNATYTNGYEYRCSGYTRQRRSCTTCGGCGSWTTYETNSSACGYSCECTSDSDCGSTTSTCSTSTKLRTTTYTCSNCTCSSSTSTQTCSYGCSSGACKECTTASHCGSTTNTCLTKSYVQTKTWSCNSGKCSSSSNLTKCPNKDCSSGACGTSSSGSSGSSSSSSGGCTKASDCGTTSYYCSGNKRYRTKYSCSSGKCSSTDTLMTTCTYGCSSGSCQTSSSGSSGSSSSSSGGCTKASDCGTTSYYCSGNKRYRTKYSCSSGKCSSTDTLMTTCTYGCSSGSCQTSSSSSSGSSSGAGTSSGGTSSSGSGCTKVCTPGNVSYSSWTCVTGGDRVRTKTTCSSDGCSQTTAQEQDRCECECGSSGACKSKVCTPNSTSCSGKQLKTCSSDGCAWASSESVACCSDSDCSGKRCGTFGVLSCGSCDGNECCAEGVWSGTCA